MKSSRQFAKMFSAHLKMTFREKQVWFWTIFFPVILMTIFMLIFGGTDNNSFKVKVAAVDPGSSPVSQAMLEQLQQIPVLEFEESQAGSIEEGTKRVENKDIDALLILPGLDDTAFRMIINTEDEASTNTQVIRGILDQFVQQANLAAAGATPIYALETESVTSGHEDLKSQDFLLTGMIALSISQSGLFGMAGMVDMRRNGLLKRLRMTPAKMGLYGLTDMLVRLVLSVIQFVLLALIGVIVFGATLHIHALSLLVAFLIGTLTFNAIGYFFSSISKTVEAYMATTNITSFLMMFLSGVFITVESLPEWLRPVTDFIPLTYFVNGMRDSLVYARGLASGDFWIGIGILALWGSISFALGTFFYRSKSITAQR